MGKEKGGERKDGPEATGGETRLSQPDTGLGCGAGEGTLQRLFQSKTLFLGFLRFQK